MIQIFKLPVLTEEKSVMDRKKNGLMIIYVKTAMYPNKLAMSFNFNIFAFLCLNNLEYANKKCKVNSGMGYYALLELRML